MEKHLIYLMKLLQSIDNNVLETLNFFKQKICLNGCLMYTFLQVEANSRETD